MIVYIYIYIYIYIYKYKLIESYICTYIFCARQKHEKSVAKRVEYNPLASPSFAVRRRTYDAVVTTTHGQPTERSTAGLQYTMQSEPVK